MILVNSAVDFLDNKSSPFNALKKYNDLLDKFCIITLYNDKFATYEQDDILFINIPKATFFLYLKKIKRILTEKDFINQYTFINSGSPFLLGVFSILLKKLLNLPLLIQIHTDITSKYFKRDGLINLIQYYITWITLPQAKVISCVNQNTYISLKNKYKNKIIELYQGLNTTNISADDTLKKANNKISYICPARLVKMKNHKSLIYAFNKFHLEYPHTTLSLYGNGPKKKELINLINKLKSDNYIEIMEYNNNVSEVYKRADFLITASLYEGFGLTVIESISYGIPVLSTPFGGALSYLDKNSSIIAKGFGADDIFKILKESQEKNFVFSKTEILKSVDVNANFEKLVNIWGKVLV